MGEISWTSYLFSQKFSSKNCTYTNILEKRNGNTFTFDEFFQEFLLTNKPVVISDLSTNWNSTKDWFSDGKINFDFLSKNFGESTIQASICNEKGTYADQKRVSMKFSSYLEYWKTRNNVSNELLYLKDWHFYREYSVSNNNNKLIYKAYELPKIFKEDWINEFWDYLNTDDYRFVYMGPLGTFTPLHADVFRSYSWSTNVIGRKQWTLFSPDQEHLLKDRSGRNTVYDIRDVYEKEFPNFKNTKPITFIQEEGETIFVPSNWFHQVENITDCISINHNWGNGCNLLSLWELLLCDYRDIEKGIEDIKNTCSEEEWLLKCQYILLVNSGMDFFQFFEFLSFIANSNLQEYSTISNQLEFFEMRKKHGRLLLILFNLEKISQTLEEMLKQQSIQILISHNKLENITSLFSTLQDFLTKSISVHCE